jgi:hypothetical protein
VGELRIDEPCRVEVSYEAIEAEKGATARRDGQT